MRFPERELEIVQLAQDMSKGLAANADVFPAPPTTPEVIDETIGAYAAAREAMVAAQGRAQARTIAKNRALQQLAARVKSNVRYVQAVANDDPSRLRLVGWGGRRAPVRNEKVAPGQVITLEVSQEGEGWVTLAWQEPFDGGTVAAYRIQRRRREGGAWTDVGTAVETTIKLEAQETGVELEYRVVGVNATGEGPVSNVVRAVL